jgi:hypothetical protein
VDQSKRKPPAVSFYLHPHPDPLPEREREVISTIFQKEETVREVLLVENILQAVGNVGFPIAVAAYLLVRIEGKLEGLTASIAELARAIEAGQSK